MKSIAITVEPGVFGPDSFGDVLEQAATAFRPICRSLARSQDRMRQMVADPKFMCELALYRLRDAVEHALSALATRRGRAYLRGEHIEEAATPEVVIAALGHIRPKWHQRTIERVTCLRAPRAQLPRTFA